MNYYVRPFRAADAEAFLLQRGQRESEAAVHTPPEKWALMEKHGILFTGFNGDRILGCAGIIPWDTGVAHAWARLAEGLSRSEFLWITRQAIMFMDRQHQTFRRIEMACAMSFPPARRWARLMGFRREGRMVAYLPNGDAELWARVRTNHG